MFLCISSHFSILQKERWTISGDEGAVLTFLKPAEPTARHCYDTEFSAALPQTLEYYLETRGDKGHVPFFKKIHTSGV